MSYRGRGRGGYHGGQYHNNNQQQHSHNQFGHQQQNVDAFVAANSIPIEIRGWNGASSSECINFISRKCRVVVSNYSVDENDGVLRGYVKSEAQAKQLLDWSGVRFAGQALRFSKGAGTVQGGASGATIGSTSMNTIETITHFLKSRYQPDIKLLNLNNVKQDPTLAAQGFFGSISTTSKFFPALMKIANDLKLDVVSIDLSNNELNDLQTISTLATTFPKLQNLSLHNNNFQRIKVFESWKHKLNFLRELVLTENPILNNPNEVQLIKLELMRCFPRLVVLNGELLRNEQALNINLTFPFDSPEPMFFQDDNIRNLASNFITNYLKLWDSNRADLMILYQNESQFSMQLDSSHPHLLDSNQTDFGYYLHNSRNLTRVSSLKARQAKLAIGQEQIFKSFTQLPKTHHDLINKPEMYSMESFTYTPLNGIMIIIHGSFEETAQPDNLDSLNQPNTGPRGRYGQQKHKKIPLSRKSFDRTFLVIPGPNGSMIVASDVLTIRPFSSITPWNKQETPVATPTPSAHSPVPPTSGSIELPPEIKSQLNPVQQELLIKILLETKLNIQYGIMLCEQSNWDYNTCSINFKNSAPTLPREAFV